MGRRDEEEEDDLDEEDDDENAELVAGLAESPPPPLEPAPAPAARAAAPAPSAPAQPPALARPRRPRAARTAGVGAPSLEKPQRGFANAIEMVDAVAAFLQAHPQAGNPSDLVVRVFAIDGAERNVGTLQFVELLAPPESPGERLQNLVIDRWHLPMNRRAAVYEIKVNWRDGSYYAGSQLRLGSTEEILSIRRAEAEAQRQPPPGYGYPPPYAQARPQYAPSYPQYREPAYAQPPFGYGAPYPYPPAPAAPAAAQPGASADPEVIRLRDELARQSGMLQEALAAAREGRQWQPAPPPPPGYPGQPGYGAPPPPAGPRSVEQIVEETVGKHVNALGNLLMVKLGLAPAPGVAGAPGAAGAPVASGPPTNGIAQELQHGVEAMVMGIVKEGLGNVGSMLRSSMKSTFTGMGAPPPEPEPLPEPEPPPNPMDDLPFQTVNLGTTWQDGRPMIYAQDKETGDIDIKASILSNPVIAESAMKLGQVLAEAAKAFAERPRMPDGTTVVGKIPRGAIDAGVGQAIPPSPPPQAAPPPPPSPPARPPAPPVHGAAAASAPPAPAAGFPSR